MRATLLATVAATAMFLAVGQAGAADIVPQNSLGMYVSVFGGASFPSNIKTHYAATLGTNYSSTLHLKSGYLLGGAIGMQFNDMVRGEIELSHSSWKGKSYSYVATTGATGSGSVSGRISATYLLANVWLDMKNESAFTPYAGGGLGVGWVHGNIDYGSGYGHGNGKNTDFAFQLGVGVKYAFSDNLSLDLGYRYKSIVNVDFKNHDPTRNDLTGGDVSSHNIQLGLTYSF